MLKTSAASKIGLLKRALRRFLAPGKGDPTQGYFEIWSGQGKLLFWGDTVECHVRSVVIVSPQPSGCKMPDLIEPVEEVMG